MAKRRRRKRPDERRTSVSSRTTRRFERPARRRKRVDYYKKFEEFVPTEDRRRFNPEGYSRPFKNIRGLPAKISIERSLRKKLPERIQFREPFATLVCRARKARRRSLFAFKKIGKGKGGPQKRKWTDRSEVKC